MASPVKTSYTVPCASAFRDSVIDLATRKGVNVGDVARSVMLAYPAETVASAPDPGEPQHADRETVVLQSGRAEGRPWKRKPRLQVRMPPGHGVPDIRRALGLALALDRGDLVARVEPPNATPPVDPEVEHQAERLREEVARLKTIVSVLAFDPLPEGPQNRSEALFVLGFAPGSRPDDRTVRARFRMLAAIHHPDSTYGNNQRMSQLNRAMELLRE